MSTPQRGEIEYMQFVTCKRHRRIANDQRPIIIRKHLPHIRRTRNPLRLKAEELAKYDLQQSGRSTRRFVQRDATDVTQVIEPRNKHDAAYSLVRANTNIRNDGAIRNALVLNNRHQRYLN